MISTYRAPLFLKVRDLKVYLNEYPTGLCKSLNVLYTFWNGGWLETLIGTEFAALIYLKTFHVIQTLKVKHNLVTV